MGGKTAFSWERPPQRDALRNGTSAGSFRKHVECFRWTLSGSLVLRQKLDGGFLVGIPEHRADDLVIATGANSVAEMRFGVFADVAFQLLPVTAVLPDLFAVGANRKKPTELFDPRERGLRLADTLGNPPLKFHHARANIQPDTHLRNYWHLSSPQNIILPEGTPTPSNRAHSQASHSNFRTARTAGCLVV